jgi:hypothetical protein
MKCLIKLCIILIGLVILFGVVGQSKDGAILVLVLFSIWFFMVVWVFSDARARGANPIAWALLVSIFNIIGFFLYLLVRPSGSLVTCTHCGRRRLAQFPRCNRCGN